MNTKLFENWSVGLSRQFQAKTVLFVIAWLACFTLPANAQFQQLKINYIKAKTTTDAFLGNTDDEVYFIVGGIISDAKGLIRTINLPRISPQSLSPGCTSCNDYFAFPKNKEAFDIPLWEDFIGRGQTALLTVLVSEQDNAQLNAIGDAISAGLATLGALAGLPTGDLAIAKFKDLASSLPASINAQADQIIAAYVVRIENVDGVFTVTWESTLGANTLIASPKNATTSMIAKGGSSDYVITTSATRPPLPSVGVSQTGMCLDVADGSLNDQAKVQQYPCHYGPNQRWRLAPRGGTVNPWSIPSLLLYYSFINDHSGKCVDVAGGSALMGAKVQQFTCHGGPNQDWVRYPATTNPPSYFFVNRSSGLCLAVSYPSTVSGAVIEQNRCDGGTNQRWFGF